MAVVIPILSEWNPAGINKAMADIKRAGSNFDKFSVGVEKAARVASVALVGLGAASLSFAQAAAEDAQQAQILAKTLKNTTNATDSQIASTEEWIKQQGRLLGVTDEKLRPALGKLVTATKDVQQAQKLASLAMDISTARGVDLESVSQTLAKAYDGNFTALKKLIPGISEAALASKDWGVIQAEVNKIVGGSAAEAADTAAGKFAIFKLSIDEAKESIGAALLPIIEKFLPKLQEMADYIEENSDKIANLIVNAIAATAGIIALNSTIKTIVVTMQLWEGIIKAVSVAMGILNGTIALNPIGLLAIAIAGLITYLVYLYNTSEKFRQKWDEVTQSLRDSSAVIRGALALSFGVLLKAIEPVVDLLDRLISGFLRFKSLVGGIGGTTTQNISPTTGSRATTSSSSGGGVYMTDEMVARGIANILQKSDLRNGSSLAFS